MNHMEKRFLCILREPFLGKIPNLNALLIHLAEICPVDIVMASNSSYPLPDYTSSEIAVHTCNESNRHTSLRILKKVFSLCRKKHYSCVIATPSVGVWIAYLIRIIFRIPFLVFWVEVPSEPGKVAQRYMEQLTNWCSRRANFSITHDDWHIQFISKVVGNDRGKYEALPNGTIGKGKILQSSYLREKLNLPDNQKIILHSGGFGIYFNSDNLAKSAAGWCEKYKLIFHTSHFVDLKGTEGNPNVIIHNNPVSVKDLDKLVASADIGIAWYNREFLGHRAEIMGLAAGKIGQYLKCGVPVIVQNIPSIREYVEKYQCGICVDQFSEIESAADEILTHRAAYSKNAILCYNELWHLDRYFQKIVNRIFSM